MMVGGMLGVGAWIIDRSDEQFRQLTNEINQVDNRINQRIDGLDNRMNERIDGLQEQLGSLTTSVARIDERVKLALANESGAANQSRSPTPDAP